MEKPVAGRQTPYTISSGRIRPWNTEHTRDRERGQYYDSMWAHALGSAPHAISITSYNEWGEGTQIEASAPHTASWPSSNRNRTFADYKPDAPSFYMDRYSPPASRHPRHHSAVPSLVLLRCHALRVESHVARACAESGAAAGTAFLQAAA